MFARLERLPGYFWIPTQSDSLGKSTYGVISVLSSERKKGSVSTYIEPLTSDT